MMPLLRYGEGMRTMRPVRTEDPAVGLCAGCARARRLASPRGSEFWLCERAATDPRFAKYPTLPVLRCPGYEPLPLAERRRD